MTERITRAARFLLAKLAIKSQSVADRTGIDLFRRLAVRALGLAFKL